MSFCRWSSDNFKSDVYVYEDCAGGYTIHMADCRVVGEVPTVDWEAEPDVLTAQHTAQMAYLDSCKHVPIGLPHDRETFRLATKRETVAKLEELRALGYHVPQFAIDNLNKEIEDGVPDFVATEEEL
jgi:hypothetical protein